MEPVLADGDTVAVEPRRIYWPGDLVAFEARDGRLLLHRAIGYWPSRRGLRLLTQADRAASPDTPAPLAALLGAVVHRSGRRVRVPAPARVRAALRLARQVLVRAAQQVSLL